MCGIVGVASTNPMTVPMKEFFCDLLYHDVVRGPHATGVAAIDTMDKRLVVEKKAVKAADFLNLKDEMENLFAFKHNFNIYIGHNRWATSGAKDADENAHPFIRGDIVGVHNGSLRDQTLLDNHKDFVVDSDNLFAHLDENGLDETIKKTNGAYALVWYNREEGTLNFLRNDERPLAIGKLSNGCWVWASEMGMLQWLVKRHKTLRWNTYKENGIEYNQVFQLEPMTHMKFEIADKSRQLPVPRLSKKTAPVFPSRYSSAHYGWPVDDYDSNKRDTRRNQSTTITPYNSSSTEYGKKVEAVLNKFLKGAVQGNLIQVEYMGKAEEASRTGYIAKLELFKYQSKNGMTVVFHQYQFPNSLCNEWTEADIGKKVYGSISGVCEINSATYACIKNEHLNASLTISGITEATPNRYYPYCEGGSVVATQEKQEGENTQNVLPFRAPQQTTTESTTKLGSTESKGQLILPSDIGEPVLKAPTTTQEFMDQKVFLGNGFMTQAEYIEAMTLNAARCSECACKLADLPASRIYVYNHFDRDTAQTHTYLHCGRRCLSANKHECDMIDEDYERRYGGNDNV